jgi:FkbM family methyltransferase
VLRRPLSWAGYHLLLKDAFLYFEQRNKAHAGAPPVLLHLKTGARLWFRPVEDQISLGTVFLQGDYNHPWILEVRAGDVLDLGCNIGCFQVWLAQQRSGLRFHALEPDPANLNLARQNALENRLTTQFLEGALADKDGELIFRRDPTSSACGTLNNLSPSESEGEKVTVRGYRLETLLAQWNLNEVDLLKMDVEGAEYQVLLNAPDEVLRRIRTLALEFHAHPEHCVHCLRKRLATAGFEVKVRLEQKNQGQLFARRLPVGS